MSLKIKEIIRQNDICLSLVKGINEDQPFHAFIATDGNKFDKLSTTTESVILGEYGTIVYSSHGHSVPEFIIEAVTTGFKKRHLKQVELAEN